ncbi:hypothetical protein T05_11166 [Trichinella murrelli]|uniref:Uncharacterized protein n=1 Tax=Trichinella murrelli TaxID=144512 RepID=A0A0V0THY3_9BILA|nr:hypothetical protein T05_2568 [Trichinella murrelli]KRX38632.1 hypothetical protein T05_11166 [Trichinella murrelli]
MNFQWMQWPTSSRWTRSTSTCRQSCLNSDAAALKERKLSDWIISGLPRRAMNRRSACIILAVGICGTSSKCTARDAMHVNKHT